MRRSYNKRRTIKKVKVNTYFKLICFLPILHGMLLVTLSYILAWFSRETVQDLSGIIVKEILAPIIVYGVCNTLMTIFEKNKLAFSTPLEFIRDTQEGTSPIESILNNVENGGVYDELCNDYLTYNDDGGDTDGVS